MIATLHRALFQLILVLVAMSGGCPCRMVAADNYQAAYLYPDPVISNETNPALSSHWLCIDLGANRIPTAVNNHGDTVFVDETEPLSNPPYGAYFRRSLAGTLEQLSGTGERPRIYVGGLNNNGEAWGIAMTSDANQQEAAWWPVGHPEVQLWFPDPVDQTSTPYHFSDSRRFWLERTLFSGTRETSFFTSIRPGRPDERFSYYDAFSPGGDDMYIDDVSDSGDIIGFYYQLADYNSAYNFIGPHPKHAHAIDFPVWGNLGPKMNNRGLALLPRYTPQDPNQDGPLYLWDARSPGTFRRIGIARNPVPTPGLGPARLGISTKQSEDDPLMIINGSELYVEKLDDGSPAISLNKYPVSALIPESSTWQNLQGISISDNGKFILARGEKNDGTGTPHGFVLQQINVGLFVDADRNGLIDTNGTSDVTSSARPYRFWINDDDDSGDTGGSDIPGDGSNDFGTGISGPPGLGSPVGVDGARDLIDWFPVILDIKSLLTALPPSGSIKYKLQHEGNVLNFVYTDLTRDHALDYQTQPLTTGFGFNFDRAPGEAQATQITATGATLSDEFLTRITDEDQGVILIEAGAATDKPLVLSVEKDDGTVLTEVKLPLQISPVEEMFRHLNLREGADAATGVVGERRDAGPATRLSNPAAFPDIDANQSWFAFVVGSNVGGQSARGWESEAFRRLYWSKSKARFLGVSWFGDPYANSSDGIYDYHLAVRNAFATAPALASTVDKLSGDIKTIAGHSLACGLISAALADQGMNVTHALLIDAAIPREVFDGRVGSGSQLSTEESDMTPTAWRSYDRQLMTTNWHERFESTSDARQTVTWRNRFLAALPKVHSFYSSTEDVLGAYAGDVPSTSGEAAAVVVTSGAAFTSYVWVYQEKAKGDRQDYWLPVLGSFHTGSSYMGWGFNMNDPITTNLPKWYVPDVLNGLRITKTPAQIGSVTAQMLEDITIQPLFRTGWGTYNAADPAQEVVDTDPAHYTGPSWIFNLYGATLGSTVAGNAANRDQLLAEAIPAQSLPVGSHKTEALEERNYDLPALFADPGWPRFVDNGLPEWRHSDMREVAYLYQSRFWDKLVSISQQP